MGWRERSTTDKFAIVGLAAGGCVGVVFAVDAGFPMQFLIIAAGALVGLVAGRAIGGAVSRR